MTNAKKRKKNQEEKILQKQMAEKLLEVSQDRINRNIKDSVFCNLFGQQEYLLQLYHALHPEDTETDADDLTIITLSRIVARNIYNDLGFLAGNRLLVLVEAQSTWSENILVRLLIYLGETYRRYIKTNELRQYDEKNIQIPKPELYVVYTGEQKERPETISLKNCFFDGENCCIDVTARVIYDSRQGDILNQYIVFSRVFDEQQRRYPRDRAKAIRETIRICMGKDVLKEYLAREEAAAVMFTFADQEEAMKEALLTEREEGEAKGRAEGEAKGRAEGEAKGRAEGKAEGKIEGENMLAALMDQLFTLGRLEDARKAVKDKTFREALFSEFKMLQ